MRKIASKILVNALALCLVMTPLAANADTTTAQGGIQMLPPLDSNGNVCNLNNPNHLDQILAWNGKDALNCVDGFSSDGKGNVSITNNAYFGGSVGIGTTALSVPGSVNALSYYVNSHPMSVKIEQVTASFNFANKAQVISEFNTWTQNPYQTPCVVNHPFGVILPQPPGMPPPCSPNQAYNQHTPYERGVLTPGAPFAYNVDGSGYMFQMVKFFHDRPADVQATEAPPANGEYGLLGYGNPFQSKVRVGKGLRCAQENGWYIASCTYVNKMGSATNNGDWDHAALENACVAGRGDDQEMSEDEQGGIAITCQRTTLQ